MIASAPFNVLSEPLHLMQSPDTRHVKNDVFECKVFDGGYVIGHIFNAVRFASNLDEVLNHFFTYAWPMVEAAQDMPLLPELEGLRNYVGIDDGPRHDLDFFFWVPRSVTSRTETEKHMRATAKRFIETSMVKA